MLPKKKKMNVDEGIQRIIEKLPGISGIGIGDDDAAKEALIGLIKIDFCGVLLHCFVSIFGGEKVNGKEISVKSMVEEAGMVEEVGMVVVKEKEVVDVDGDSSKRSE